jgi:DNA-binding response OmpR family regulator
MARILVMDDDEVGRMHMGAVIQAAGHEVGYASDGEQGVAFYKESPFDAVVVDLAMPKKNGIQAIRELCAMDRDVRIIAVSGVSPEQLTLAEEAGAMRTLVKPIHADELMQAVAGVLRRRTGWQGARD